MASPFDPVPGGIGMGAPTAEASPERAVLTDRWRGFLGSPQVQAALVQMGTDLMQPKSRFDNNVSVLGRAAQGGAAAAGRVNQQQEAIRRAAVEEGIEAREAAVAERAATADEERAAADTSRAASEASRADTARRTAGADIALREGAAGRDAARLDLERRVVDLKAEADAAAQRRKKLELYTDLYTSELRYGPFGETSPAIADARARKIMADAGVPLEDRFTPQQKREWTSISQDPIRDQAARAEFGDDVVDGIYLELGLTKPGAGPRSPGRPEPRAPVRE